jgi:hypothetical protein
MFTLKVSSYALNNISQILRYYLQFLIFQTLENYVLYRVIYSKEDAN